MTVIVADTRTGVMAADAQWTDATSVGLTRKVFRVKGSLIGVAGDMRECALVLEWFRGGMKGHPPKGGDVGALVLSSKGLHTWSASDGLLPEQSKFFAIGSGAHAARGAMMAGADCVAAVRIACNIDAGSGGRVRAYRLER